MIVDDRERAPEEILARYAEGERDFTGLDINDHGAQPSFRGARLDGADFSHSFVLADFTGARLRGERFVGANVKTCVFDGADLRDADFSDAPIDGASFEGCTFDGARFEGAGSYGYTYAKGELPR
jgi:2-iminobutanoate/2-iminopropanoate deaminase